MKRSAYSLIELVVAITVVGLISAVALPNFNTLLRANELEGDAVNVADCITLAQRRAGTPAPGDTFRYTYARIITISGGLRCTIGWVDGSYSRTQLQAGAPTDPNRTGTIPFSASSNVQSVALASIATSTGYTSSLPRAIEVYFDSQRLGAPWLIRTCPTDSLAFCDSTPEPSTDISARILIGRGVDERTIHVPGVGGPARTYAVAPAIW